MYNAADKRCVLRKIQLCHMHLRYAARKLLVFVSVGPEHVTLLASLNLQNVK